MMFRRAAATGIALSLLAGCATTTSNSGSAPTQVTRFHLGQPIAPGEVAIEARYQGAGDTLEFKTYEGAVGAELTRLGFRVAPAVSKSEIVAVVDIMRGTQERLASRSPFSIGIGGASFGGGRGGGVGLGGGVSFPIGKRRSNDVVQTEMSVQLKRRSDGSAIWEGRARTQAREGSNASDADATAHKLATALFSDFPGESNRTIMVK